MSFGGRSFDSVRRLALVDGPDDQRVTTGELEIGITYRENYMIVVYDPATPAHSNFRGVPTLLRSRGTLNTIFTDGTSGVTTYGAGRSLMISEVDENGQVRLDFNQALNLPGAFSDNFPFCPLPPAGNRLPFAVEAGERTPREKTA